MQFERRQGILAFCILGGALTAVFYAPILLHARVWVFRDMYSVLLPQQHIVQALQRETFFPLWNPYQVFGKPLFAEPLSGLVYPPAWLFLQLPLPYSYNASVAVHHFIGALGMFLLVRAFGCGFAPSLFGAIVFSFGGMYVSLDNILNGLTSITWLPWTLLCTLLVYRRPGMKESVLLALSVAMSFLAGMPETIILENLTFVAVLGWLLCDRAYGWPRVGRVLFCFIFADVLAGLLSAVHLLPMLEYVALSSRAKGMDVASVLSLSLHPADLLSFFVPVPLLDHTGLFAPPPRAFGPPMGNVPLLITKYLGIWPLFSIPALMALPRKPAVLVVLFLTACLVLSMAGHVPGFASLLTAVPLLRVGRYPEKALLLFHVTVAVVAAMGVDRFTRGRGGSSACIVLCTLCFLDLWTHNGHVLPAFSWADVAAAPHSLRAITRQPWISGPAPTRIFAEQQGNRRLDTLADEVAQRKEGLFESIGALYGLDNVRAASSINLADHERFMKLFSDAKDKAAVVRSFGVQYVLTPKLLSVSGGLALLSEPRETNGSYVYGVLDARPRTYVPARVLTAPSAEDALRMLISDPGVTVVARADIHGEAVSAGRGTSSVARYETDHVVLDVQMESEGLVVLLDSLYPGWRAYVDGQETSLLRVNQFARGVVAPRGRHQVLFRYQPATVQVGAIVSLATLLGAIAFLMMYPVQRRDA